MKKTIKTKTETPASTSKIDPNEIIFWSQESEYWKKNELDHIRSNDPHDLSPHTISLCGVLLKGEGTFSIPSDGYDIDRSCMKCVEIYQENRKK